MASSKSGSDDFVTWLNRLAAGDGRVAFRPALSPHAVVKEMRACSLVAVPSRWLETGPLVVLEAFAAGTPVLGARLGGISELVTDGENGVLLPPDNPQRWAREIARMAADPARLLRLRQGVRRPRSMADVAQDMASLYRTMLGEGN